MITTTCDNWPGRLLRAFVFPALLFGQVHGQAFELRPGREAVIVGLGISLHGSALLLENKDRSLPSGPFDADRVLGIDRVATRNWSVPAHRASNVLFGVAVAASLTTAIVGEKNSRPLVPVIIIAEAGLLTSGLTNTVKELVRRPRPYLYNPSAPNTGLVEHNDQLSFWSGHTASNSAIAFTCANLVQRSDASKGLKTATWIGAAVAPAAIGYLRVRAGRHFPTDVLTGYAVGALVGWAVPYFHRAAKGNH